MLFDEIMDKLVEIEGVEKPTMMKSPCPHYKGDFMAMMFNKEQALIIKVSPERVNEYITQSKGYEFNFTGKRFKEWALIPMDFEEDYQACVKRRWFTPCKRNN